MPNKKTALPFLFSGLFLVLLCGLYILSFKYETFTLEKDAAPDIEQQLVNYAFPEELPIDIQFEVATLTYSSAEKENLLSLQIAISASQIEDLHSFYNNYTFTEIAVTPANTIYEINLPLTDEQLINQFLTNATSNFAHRNILFLSVLIVILLIVSLFFVAKRPQENKGTSTPNDDLSDEV